MQIVGLVLFLIAGHYAFTLVMPWVDALAEFFIGGVIGRFAALIVDMDIFLAVFAILGIAVVRSDRFRKPL